MIYWLHWKTAFPRDLVFKFRNWQEDNQQPFIRYLAKWAYWTKTLSLSPLSPPPYKYWFFFSLCWQLGTFLNTIKRILDVLHCKVEDKLKTWASYLPIGGDKKSNFGEQMNEITVLLRTKYKNYMQAIVVKLVANVSSNINLIIFPLLSWDMESSMLRYHEVRSQLSFYDMCSSLSWRPQGFNRIGKFPVKAWKVQNNTFIVINVFHCPLLIANIAL